MCQATRAPSPVKLQNATAGVDRFQAQGSARTATVCFTIIQIFIHVLHAVSRSAQFPCPRRRLGHRLCSGQRMRRQWFARCGLSLRVLFPSLNEASPPPAHTVLLVCTGRTEGTNGGGIWAAMICRSMLLWPTRSCTPCPDASCQPPPEAMGGRLGTICQHDSDSCGSHHKKQPRGGHACIMATPNDCHALLS